MIDRSEVSRALAKAIAFKACGKDQYAAEWAAKLIYALELEGILRSDVRSALASHRHPVGA